MHTPLFEQRAMATTTPAVISCQPTPSAQRARADALLHVNNSLLDASVALNLNITGNTSMSTNPDGEADQVFEEAEPLDSDENSTLATNEEEKLRAAQFLDFLEASRLRIDELVEERVNDH